MAQARRKKRFFDVEIPLIKKETQLQGYELSDLDGKIIKYDLTRLLKGKGMLIRLKIKVDYKDKITITPLEARLLPYFLKRMMRKRVNYVEDSFSIECKDAKLRIKPFLITRKKVSRSVRKALRDKAKEELIEYAKNKSSTEIFEDLIKNQIQKPLSLKLKKIYPLSLCEIRILKVEEVLEKKPKREAKKE